MVDAMTIRSAWALLALLCLLGCDNEQGLNERRGIHDEDMPAVKTMIRDDLVRGMRGVRQVAARFQRGFLVEDRAQLAPEMRRMLGRLRDPRNVRFFNVDLMRTPVSFIAAVGTDGRVIARNAEDDQMAGFDLAEAVPVVRQALNGEAGYALSEIPSLEEDQPGTTTVIFAAPSTRDGEVVGVIAAGLPLWRIAQQLSNQLQLDNADAKSRGALFWALLLHGEEQHYHGAFPPDLRELVPNPSVVRDGLEASPGGFTGEVQQYGRWYGYGVLPLPTVGEDVSVVLFRSDPV